MQPGQLTACSPSLSNLHRSDVRVIMFGRPGRVKCKSQELWNEKMVVCVGDRRREEPSTHHAGIHIGRRETSFVDANVDGGATFILWPCLLGCRWWLRKPEPLRDALNSLSLRTRLRSTGKRNDPRSHLNIFQECRAPRVAWASPRKPHFQTFRSREI
jgi:hypothetical protein